MWSFRQRLATEEGFEASDVLHQGDPAEAKISPADLPSFFVVGPPRTGTTWLHEVLRPHTNLPDPTKETRFFDSHFHRGMSWYRDKFPLLQPDRPTGEVAPTYFSSREARQRIANTLPGAKLIFVFRDPIQRIVSLYRMKRAYGMVAWNFEEALERDPELLESGKYASYLREWQNSFPQDQLCITLYDDLRGSPQAYMDALSRFLQIPRILLNNAELSHVHSSERMTEPRNFVLTRFAVATADWCKAHKLDPIVAAVRNSHLMKFFLGGGAPFPEVSHAARKNVATVLGPEIDELEAMIGRNLSQWKFHVSRSAR